MLCVCVLLAITHTLVGWVMFLCVCVQNLMSREKVIGLVLALDPDEPVLLVTYQKDHKGDQGQDSIPDKQTQR